MTFVSCRDMTQNVSARHLTACTSTLSHQFSQARSATESFCRLLWAVHKLPVLCNSVLVSRFSSPFLICSLLHHSPAINSNSQSLQCRAPAILFPDLAFVWFLPAMIWSVDISAEQPKWSVTSNWGPDWDKTCLLSSSCVLSWWIWWGVLTLASFR